ncbi:MAG: glycosyltransferase family 39 protein [Solirubrobacterales bacterium]|nr:glycosyltransferase family 39 protein [Solirubrobacterales bacterium]
MSRRAAHAALGLVVLVTTALAGIQGARVDARILYDEQLTVEGARFVGRDLPSSLWATGEVFPRGPERLTAWLLAFVDALPGSTQVAMVGGRLAVALLYALAALPAYALARGLGTERGWAVGAAALAVLTPWLAFGITFLNTAAAFTTTLVAVWAMWRTIVRPSPRADAVAVLALVLLPLARVSHAGLAAALPVALLVTTWRDLAGPAGARARALPRRVWEEHAVLVVAAVVGVLAVLAVGLSSFTGEYDASAGFPAQHLWDQARAALAQLGSGLGLAAFVVGLGWIAGSALRPTTREAGAFAVLALALAAVLLYLNKTGNIEERYIAPLGPLLAIAAVVALARREVRVWPTAIVAALLVLQFASAGYVDAGADRLARLFVPAQLWFSRVGVERLTTVVSFDRETIAACWALVAAAVALGLAWLQRRRAGAFGPVAAAVLGATIVLGAAGGAYSAQKLRTSLGDSRGSVHDLTFVDRAVGDDRVSALAYDQGNAPQVPFVLDLVHLYNGAVRNSVSFDGAAGYSCCADGDAPGAVRIDPRTGEVATQGIVHPWLLVPSQYVPAGLAGEVRGSLVGGDPPVFLVRLAQPLRAAYAVEGGTTRDGWARERPVRVRVFGGAARRCLHATIVAAPVLDGELRWRLGSRQGRLAPGAAAFVDVPVDGAQTRDLVFRAGPVGRLDDGRRASAGLRDLFVRPCR